MRHGIIYHVIIIMSPTRRSSPTNTLLEATDEPQKFRPADLMVPTSGHSKSRRNKKMETYCFTYSILRLAPHTSLAFSAYQLTLPSPSSVTNQINQVKDEVTPKIFAFKPCNTPEMPPTTVVCRTLLIRSWRFLQPKLPQFA